jgi:hypothetical protein
MITNTKINIILRIFLYWLVAMSVSTIVISYFSCFYPMESLLSYFQYGFYLKFFIYFKITIYFYLFVSFLIGLPGFIINLSIYHFRNKTTDFKLNKLLSIVSNVCVGLIILYFYYSLNISKTHDFLVVILPSYIVSMVVWGIILLPGKANAILK